MYDIPASLKELQEWFGEVVATPLQKNNKLKKDENTPQYILDGPKLSSHERIEIYHQQYWWRLLKVMQDNFPTVTRLFGLGEFNHKIAIPYIDKYPPNHFSLFRLGDKLVEYLELYYFESDKEIVKTMATIDLAFINAFCSSSIDNISDGIGEEEILYLQPHVQLFSMNADYFTFRDHFLEHPPEYYGTNPFPKLNKESSHILLFRDVDNMVTWKKIPQAAYLLLNQIKAGNSLKEAISQLEQMDSSIVKQAEEEISLWLYDWFSRKIFYFNDNW